MKPKPTKAESFIREFAKMVAEELAALQEQPRKIEPAEPQMVSVAEYKKRLGDNAPSEQWIREQFHKGELQGRQIGKRIMIYAQQPQTLKIAS